MLGSIYQMGCVAGQADIGLCGLKQIRFSIPFSYLARLGSESAHGTLKRSISIVQPARQGIFTDTQQPCGMCANAAGLCRRESNQRIDADHGRHAVLRTRTRRSDPTV